MTEIRTRRYAVALVVVTVLTGLNAYALKTFDVVGVPFVFGTALLVQLLLIISFAFSLVIVLHTPLKIALSILASAAQGIQGNPYIVRLRRRYPRLAPWVGQRFSPEHPGGLVLTAGVAAAVASLLLFLNITRAVVLRTSFAGLDQRIINLVPGRPRDGDRDGIPVPVDPADDRAYDDSDAVVAYSEDPADVDDIGGAGEAFFAGDPGAATRETVTAREEERFGGIKIGSAFFGWLTATGMAVLLAALVTAAGTAGLLSGTDLMAAAGQTSSPTVGMAGMIVLLVILFLSFFRAAMSPGGWRASTASVRGSWCGCGQ